MKVSLLVLLSGLCLPAVAATGISLDAMLSALIDLVIISLIFWAVWWFLGYVGIPEPFNKVIRVIIGLAALIIVINILLGLAGHPFFR